MSYISRPNWEWLDPVRFISNPSSGKMGYALAKAAVESGMEVILVSGLFLFLARKMLSGKW